MQRLSKVSSHLAHSLGSSGIPTKLSTTTPRQADRGVPATPNITTMAKTKVVVTRQLIDEAQRLLDAKKEELEIVQWRSEKVRVQWIMGKYCSLIVNHHSHATARGCSRMQRVPAVF